MDIFFLCKLKVIYNVHVLVLNADANKLLLKKGKNYYPFQYQLSLHKINVENMQLYKVDFPEKLSAFLEVFFISSVKLSA